MPGLIECEECPTNPVILNQQRRVGAEPKSLCVERPEPICDFVKWIGCREDVMNQESQDLAVFDLHALAESNVRFNALADPQQFDKVLYDRMGAEYELGKG